MRSFIKNKNSIFQQVPEVNATFENNTIRLSETVDISVAVATEAGLITPIIKDAAGRGIKDIANNIKVTCAIPECNPFIYLPYLV